MTVEHRWDTLKKKSTMSLNIIQYSIFINNFAFIHCNNKNCLSILINKITCSFYFSLHTVFSSDKIPIKAIECWLSWCLVSVNLWLITDYGQNSCVMIEVIKMLTTRVSLGVRSRESSREEFKREPCPVGASSSWCALQSSTFYDFKFITREKILEFLRPYNLKDYVLQICCSH